MYVEHIKQGLRDIATSHNLIPFITISFYFYKAINID